MQFLRNFFGDRFISQPRWLPRSPDLTLPDFYLWGYNKDRVFQHPSPTSIPVLKLWIIEAINEITPAALKQVFRNMQKRVRACLHKNGGHFEHNAVMLIFVSIYYLYSF